MASEVTAADLERRILAGDVRALARAATLIENRTPAGRELIAAIASHADRAVVVGITGPPGAGKSTLVNQLTKLARSAGQTVGVLAIDPSSPYSRGALLGDRIRMQEHSGDPGVFIRSLASRGAPGGIARATQELVLLLDAAGRDLVLIETVGAGQDEVEIARLAAVTVVVLAPGFGDDVQAEKAGMMEIADVFAINKADLPEAGRLEQEMRASGIAAPIRRVIATEGTGCTELFHVIHDAYRAATARERIPLAASIQIDHLGIAVRSLDEGLAFYERLLGMRVSRRETVEAEHVSVAMLPAGDAAIELLEATDTESVIARFLDKSGPGLHHVA
ncbi:MAG: methylmalonyl Co-A mutase-associated GTPase MeaB, partial [Bryobacteraceae bacterium]